MTNLPEHLSDPRFAGFAVAYGLTTAGDEVVVMRRMYNTVMTIGPAGEPWFRDQW